ncbi:MAG: peroxide stress protein YaaA [Clostridia bacterium]|nr:peroxide stress protein YaaA [Clostridia bacterium]MBR5265635.1 peroxide stress protein YaaA [Clostridia bacterium]
MKIIISPAKKMREDDGLEWKALPQFLDRAEEIKNTLKAMSYDELKKLWKCNDDITKLNVERLSRMELTGNLTPAVLAYEGIQYQYMAPGVFTEEQLGYIDGHLRIISGFYGLLRPFDGVRPYRLEMQAKLKIGKAKDLYIYWNDLICKELCRDDDCIIDLASKEYSIAVSKHLPEGVKMISIVFGEEKDGKIIEKGTMCKMARGEMVRFMAENNITSPEGMKAFDRLDYIFDEARSTDTSFVFVKRPKKVTEKDEW